MASKASDSKKVYDEDDESDEENEGATPQERLTKLYDRKDELHVNLQHIDVSLAKLGYSVDSVATKEAKKDLQTGIRIDNQLSFRGKAVATEYFKRLDEDNDGYLTWEDFRAMKSIGADFVPALTGLVHDTEYLTWESWKMHIADMGVKLDHLGRLELDEFIKYRTLVEMRKPLNYELKAIDMAPLPPKLVLWAKMKEAINELISDAPLSKQNEFETRGLTFDEVTFLLCNIGNTYTRPEFFLNMAYRAQHENLMQSLKNKFLKQVYALTQDNQYTVPLARGSISQRAIELTIDHIKYTKVNQLVAWIFSGRPPPEKQKGLYHRLLRLKYETYRKIRYYDKLCKLMFSIGYQLRMRRVFDDFKPIPKLTPQQAVKSSIEASIDIVGSGGNLDTGMGFEWGCQRVDHPEQFLTNHKLPREAGFAVIIELMLKSDVKDHDAEQASVSLLQFVKQHLDAELKKNLQFRGIFCFPAQSEGDGAPVLRLAFCYKRIVSFDAWFDSMLLPYGLNDLICGFAGALKTNVAMTDILNKDSTFALDTLMSARLEASIQYRVYPIMNLFKRVKLALSAAFTEHQTRDGSEDQNEVYRRRLREYYPTIVSWAEFAERLIRGQKGLNLSFVFKKLSDALSKLGAANHWFGQHFPPSIGSLSGYVTQAYASWAANFLKEYGEIFDPLRLRMENKVKQEEADEEAKNAAIRMGLAFREEQAEVTKGEAIMDKLKMLGIEMDEDDVMAEDAHDPASLIQNAGERLVKNDQSSLFGFEKIHEVLLGVHSVQVLCGKFKLNCSVSGFDIFEAIPKFPSLQQVKKETEERKENLKKRSDEKRREERQARIRAREEQEEMKRKEERRKAREAYEREMS